MFAGFFDDLDEHSESLTLLCSIQDLVCYLQKVVEKLKDTWKFLWEAGAQYDSSGALVRSWKFRLGVQVFSVFSTARAQPRGGKGGRIKYLVLKGERVKVELYQWRQLSHDRLYITSVLSINLRIVAFFSKCDTKIRRSFKSCIVQITCAKLYYQELYSIHCRLYRILTFVCGNFKTYLLFVHQIISSVLVFQESFYMKMSKTQWRHKSYLKIWLWIVETVFRFWCFHFVVCMWCHNDHVFDAVMYHGKE